jgi:UDP-glucose 6-dehydrogenase
MGQPSRSRALNSYTVIVTKSTAPVGTGQRISEIVPGIRLDADFDVGANSEFLRRCNANGDFMRPDRVVIWRKMERQSKHSIRWTWIRCTQCCPTPLYIAAGGADGLVLITERNEFRALDPVQLREAMRGRVFISSYVYAPHAMRKVGFDYDCVGLPA